MRIKEVMTKKVMTAPIEKGLHEVIRQMSEGKKSSVVITGKDNRPVGVVTERDLIKKILLLGKNPKKAKIEEVMSRPIVSVHPDSHLHDASLLMHQRGIRHLPVIENDRLVGMITQTDIVKETHNIHKKNVTFMNYQNIQSAIIILFFIFLVIWFIYKTMNS